MKTRFTAVAAAWLALGATAAHAAQESRKPLPCVTSDEAEAIVTVLAPALLQGVGTACRPSLPAGAYLRERGDALAQRFAAPASAARPRAVAAAVRIGGPEVQALAESPMLDVFLSSMAGELVKGEIKGDDCMTISNIAEQLDPLPPVNLSRMIVLIAQAGLKGDKKAPFAICATAGA